MKIVNFLYLSILVLCCQIGFSQTIWQGQYHSYRIVVKGDFESAKDSLLLSLPELQYESIKVGVRKNKDSISFKNEMYNFSFKGKYNSDKTAVEGVFNHYSIPNAAVILKKQSEITPLFFAQHPQKPYPYQVIDMTFLGKNTKLTYGATLTIPNNKKKYPLAILVSGTGQHDRNYTFMGRESFTVLADYLAKNGIASLRVDDRGYGKTTGDFENATTGDFANDVEEQIAYLKSDKNIDPSYIGLIGHSEGGMIASIVSSRNKDVKFMISLSGVGVSGLEMLNLQNTAILKSYKFSDKVVAKQMEMYNIMFNVVYNTKDNESAKPAMEVKLKEWMQQQDTTTLKEVQMWDGRDQTFLYRYGKDADRKWYRYTIHYKPENFLPKITVPVFIANGDKDIQVPAVENIESFKKYLGTKDLTTKIYPGLNHMYQHCKTCTQNEAKEIDEVFAPEVLDDIAKWILARYKK
ncbi:pimeloyl-ACP methyl ester carboxylesterase [Flavobacterium nitrogenifigens]|uniref:Pimeloyl-ACP methyl ester carboxylesterase n=2 Tax=Flavobacterium TaxID=237 RepID=A0A7W7IX29_9FLAO|nr:MULTISPECIES: alpha/beta hydrolase [Flavobacterium]MBB4802194.1 pimeloyl-ACP methyl ester carboxylesterase [Flavobacterium nitrogenifigens]MBB6387152.1 pimeloyl-ACP methyl ester carboxylesterase [Flavobacterium notoginsengisoli]